MSKASYGMSTWQLSMNLYFAFRVFTLDDGELICIFFNTLVKTNSLGLKDRVRNHVCLRATLMTIALPFTHIDCDHLRGFLISGQRKIKIVLHSKFYCIFFLQGLAAAHTSLPCFLQCTFDQAKPPRLQATSIKKRFLRLTGQFSPLICAIRLKSQHLRTSTSIFLPQTFLPGQGVVSSHEEQHVHGSRLA